ncbi:hypothetical protein CHU_2386 [Sporocytophaga myxococcoides]|uniref:Uncharacterized protein n=1 Tax=Sporocytophaga myxococcoides TaxID=153721 RepID=A0A098LM30_9BACT|nr:hypothetical protein [Sporocytophaga myxococcoides]GAL87387.1 hypothetical protein CHU_2386 [Sporocytophaga myxococcoides]
MNKTIGILIFTLVTISSRAEYIGYHIKFTIETKKGETRIGFVYVPSAYLDMDSIENTNYLKYALDQSWDDRSNKDSLFYFKERIKYQYQEVGDTQGEEREIYSLSNKQSISYQDIKLIRIIEMQDFTYLTGVSSPLSVTDIPWISKKPLQGYAFSGYLCYYQVFVHVKSKKIEGIIKRLTAKQKSIESIDVNHENGDGVDEELWEIIKELYGEKVVVITECTC